MKILKYIVWNIIFIVIFFFVCELLIRFIYGDRINYQGTSSNLYQENVYYDSYGWKANTRGTSFGAEITINSMGLRGKDIQLATQKKKILLVGDSVPFGVGVTDSQTVDFYMNSFFEHTWQIINSSVIGYGIYDYKNVVSFWLKATPIDQVYLLYTLNDFYRIKQDSLNIISFTQKKPLEQLLTYLREHSKFYLWFKNGVLARGKSFFLYDYNFYKQHPEQIHQGLLLLKEIGDLCTVNDAEYKIVLLPYRYQYLDVLKDPWYPQQFIRNFLQAHEIQVLDAYQAFNKKNNIDEFYLYGDPMHLSAKGHKKLAHYIAQSLD